MKEKTISLTERQFGYLQSSLIQIRELERQFAIKQNKDYAPIRNKITNILREFEGKEPI